MAQYCAFISYSHSDIRFATWLQRKLENFRIPTTTVRKLKLDSNRLGQVFRDVADLAAASELTQVLQDALANSSTLIIICSPASVASNWVGLEVEEFRRVHGQNAVILPIVSPTAGLSEAEQMLPDALRESSPLAADARRSGDGRRIALLKLVAGLLGTGLDELIQRDTRRRHARLVGAISVTTTLALVMAVLAVLAVSAREDAKRRLSQSEDLISFMLGDLRAQLTPLGQVRLLESVGAKALTYFESLPDEDLTEAALLRKTRALYQIGEVYFELGNFQAAHNSFKLSLDQAHQLAAEQPDNVERLFEWSQAEFWAGYAAWYAGDLGIARDHLKAYHQLAWALVAKEPGNADWIMETFWASNNLGSLAFARGEFEEALEHFEGAIVRINELIKLEATSDRLLEKAATLSWLGSTYFHLGNLNLSKESYQGALEEPLDPENALQNLDRSYFYRKLSEVEVYRGEMIPARAHAESALTIAGLLSESDPDSMKFLYARTTHALQLALLDAYDQLPVDFDGLREAVDELLTIEQPPPDWLSLALRVAEIGIRTKHPQALAWAKTILGRVKPEGNGWDVLQNDYINLLVTASVFDESMLAVVEKFLPSLEAEYENSGNFALVLALMRCYDRLGRTAELTALREVVLRSGSRHPMLISLSAQ
jgi:tetratricopeptide (TPR) repeat protein